MINILKLREMQKQASNKDENKEADKAEGSKIDESEKVFEVEEEVTENENLSEVTKINEQENIEIISYKPSEDPAEILRKKLLAELEAGIIEKAGEIEDAVDYEDDQNTIESLENTIPKAKIPIAQTDKQVEEVIPKSTDPEVKAAKQINNEKTSESEKKIKDEEIQIVGFILGDEHYGVAIDKIQEIYRMSEITRVPNAPKYIEGVINLRGAVLPVVNLRIKIGMPTKQKDNRTRIIIIEIEEMSIGFIVDEVREVIRINSSIISSPNEFTVNVKTEYITGVAKLDGELIIIIDPEKLLLDR